MGGRDGEHRDELARVEAPTGMPMNFALQRPRGVVLVPEGNDEDLWLVGFSDASEGTHIPVGDMGGPSPVTGTPQTPKVLGALAIGELNDDGGAPAMTIEVLVVHH